VSVDTTSAPANGSTPADISVILKNSLGQPVSGKTITMIGSVGASATITPISVGGSGGSTNAQGLAEFQVRDEVAETVTFAASDQTDGNLALDQTVMVTFTPGIGDANQSDVSASPTSVALNGTSTVTVALLDHFANPVAGKSVTLAASTGTSSVISPSTPATTNASGVATFSVTDASAETVTYTATDSTDSVQIDETVAITFGTPDVVPSVADSALVANTQSVPADGSSSATISVTLNDDSGLPVPGKTVELIPSGGSSVVTAPPATGSIRAGVTALAQLRDHLLVSATTATDGTATFTVADKTAEVVTFTATDTTDNLPITGLSVKVTFTAATATSSATTSSTTVAAAGSSTGAAAASGGSGGSVSGSDSTDGGTSSGGSSSSGASSTPGLAFTGAPSLLPWLVGIGLLLMILGTVGQRFVRSSRTSRS
jgi:hypothetical protein